MNAFSTETQRHGEAKLLRRFKRMLGCDSARISRPCGRLFLVIGFKRSTRDIAGEWTNERGERMDWEFMDEKCVASGADLRELMASAKLYKKLCGMTWDELFSNPAILERLNSQSQIADSRGGGL